MARRSNAGQRLSAIVFAAFVAAVMLVAAAESAPAQSQPAEEGIGLLFAQTASKGTFKPIKGTPRFRLSLRGVNPQVVWFSDRPARQSGQIPVRGFTRSWAGFGFNENPPNAALTLLRADENQDTVIVELRNPRYRKKTKRKPNRLSYSARLLNAATGNLSYLESDRDRRVKRRFRVPSLFIDDAAANVIGDCVIAPYTKCPGASLAAANLKKADLKDADLTDANLFGAFLSQADLSGANLSRAYLSRADLRYANLTAAKLVLADLTGADLTVAELGGAILVQADLAGAKLRAAKLFGANLSIASLHGADLREADLSGANLIRADLSGADLSGANLSGARFCRTKMPGGGYNDSDCR
ncbi:MAG: pentapeptide repeat-containing protein [Solirubrobacterales bacterium]|nr:pentapeptide repeat-containing protein [Solirubrobacterales bacterium]